LLRIQNPISLSVLLAVYNQLLFSFNISCHGKQMQKWQLSVGNVCKYQHVIFLRVGVTWLLLFTDTATISLWVNRSKNLKFNNTSLYMLKSPASSLLSSSGRRCKLEKEKDKVIGFSSNMIRIWQVIDSIYVLNLWKYNVNQIIGKKVILISILLTTKLYEQIDAGSTLRILITLWMWRFTPFGWFCDLVFSTYFSVLIMWYINMHDSKCFYKLI